MHGQHAVPECLRVAWRWEYHTLSMRRWDYNTLSGRCWEYDALSVHWEHDSLSAAHCEYDTLSAVWLCHYATIMLTTARWGAIKKTTISDTDDCRLTTWVNSASTAPPIGLPPKMAKFCHTSNRLLVGHWCRRAQLRLYFNFSASNWLVSWSHNKGSQALGGFPPKGLSLRWCFLLKRQDSFADPCLC